MQAAFCLAVLLLMGNRKLESTGGKKKNRGSEGKRNELGCSVGEVQKENLVTMPPVEIFVAFYRIISIIPVCVYALLRQDNLYE